jgi:HAMP domain-containing protein
MSSLQQRLVAVSDMRLAAIAAAANLKIQLSELERLREQVRKTLEIAELETVRCYGVTQVPN